ncbi:glycosyl hydrolase [Bacillus sp. ISL-51]|uniref:glycoside hydrolase family 30 protein n=2 Tax=Bacteria TaxID=2 RepID=UPI001BE7984A|nr:MULTISPECIES: glycoside hydrolase family 30 beta sandwich domain-containing protein [Bacteria]MBT2575328.1 glycosyl hydrolase [Bacillus sp. ISL-51]MBT2712966.1 hypothetical protein [Pseudomonas sp. ISL-88]
MTFLKLSLALLLTSLLLTSSMGNPVHAADHKGTGKNKVRVWYSSEKDPASRSWYDGPKEVTYALDEQTPLTLKKKKASDSQAIYIDPSQRYQSILGIGSSLEESSVNNLSKMSPEKREEVLKKLVDPHEGIGMDVMRITIGTSDFTAQEFYTYDDMPKGKKDPKLKNFSIQKDIDLNITATIKQALRINPKLKIIASPWSPPAWMKTNESLSRGKLKDQYVDELAAYYRKFIEAYKKQGIPIYAMTLQNEPLLEIDYPSMYMPPAQQRVLAITLKMEMKKHSIDTKIWIYDHNASGAWNYIPPILDNKKGNQAADGIAFHDYDGDLSVMSEIGRRYPEKSIHLTERSVWGTEGADRIAQYFRNGASSYNAWVTMLDSHIQTHHWIGTPDPTLFIQDAKNPDHYWNIPIYHITGNFSKFVDRGAKRIESNYGSKNTVTNVSFLNPDHSIVTVVINQTSSNQTFRAVSEHKQFEAVIPAKTVATYKWDHKKK